MKKQFIRILILFLCGLLLVSQPAGRIAAQEGTEGNTPTAPEGVSAAVSNRIPIQGRLTDAAGNPLTGTYTVAFRLYEGSSGGTALCSDSHAVTATNGLFSTDITGCGGHISGQQLYLGIQVGSDAEMTPRQPIYAVPYAFGLVPGADVVGSLGAPVLYVENQSTAALGMAVRGRASATSGMTFGVHGDTASAAGYGGYFWNSAGGTALYSDGKFQSSKESYVWISGNGVRPYRQSDTTIIDMNTVGGARIMRGSNTENKNVMLPITIPGTLYGQNVRLTGLDIYWVGDTDFDSLTAVLLRRQTGVCSSSSCYATLVHDSTDRVCVDGEHPTGCQVHFNLTSNNVLSPESGILYLTLEFGFSGSTTWVEVGGVRLTLEHD